jgi:hypothetical protein
MKRLRPLFALVLLAASLLLGGCASTGNVSLFAVREFADASSKLAGYGELSTRYRDTYLREQPYLTPAADKIARENDAKRRAVYDDFVSIQKAVVVYMQTLSMLAGDARYDLTPQIDELGGGLRSMADGQLEKRHVTAYTGLTRLLTRAIASNFQNRSVETMVRDGDADLQALIDAMITLTRLYEKSNENEKKTVLGIFDIEVPYATKPQDRMLVTMAKVHYLNKATEYKLIDKRFSLAKQGLTKVSLGHQKLREHLNDMGSTELRHTVGNYARDLKLVHDGLSGK